MISEDDNIVEAIQKAHSDESKAIKALLDRNAQSIISFVKRHGGSNEEAEDVLMEGVTELVFNIKKNKYKGTGSLNAYLSRICKYIWYQKYRSGKIDKNQEEIKDVYLSESFTIELDDKKGILDTVLNQIGSTCKQILILWSQSFNMKEIQSQMEYASPQVAMNKKSKCIKKLMNLVNQNPKLREILQDLR